jgi:hypothetical protein
MEAAGTGVDKIVQEYSDVDEGHKPYIYSTSDHFTLVLPDLTYAEGIAMDEGSAVEFVPVPNGTDHDEKVAGHAVDIGGYFFMTKEEK